VSYAEQIFPNFSDDYEINVGGIKLNTTIDCKIDQQVTVSIFGTAKQHIKVQGSVVETINECIIIRFTPLVQAQQDCLSNILELQQPIDPHDQ